MATEKKITGYGAGTKGGFGAAKEKPTTRITKKSKSKDVADLSGKRKDKYKVLSKIRVVTPSGKEKPVRKTPIISRMTETSQTKDGPKITAFSAKAYNQDRSTEPTKFKDIDSRVYGLKSGGKVKLALRGGGRAFGKNS